MEAREQAERRKIKQFFIFIFFGWGARTEYGIDDVIS